MEYIIKRIDDLCYRITDGAHNSPEECPEGQYPMYSSKDMLYGGFDDTNIKMISKQDFDRLAAQDCQPLKDDILIIKDGANYLKYVFRVSEKLNAVILSSIAILRPNSSVIDADYFTYLLRTNSIRSAMSNYVSGAAIPRIVLKDFKKMKLRITPSVLKQREIAEKILPIDNLIEVNNKRIKVLEQMAENLYKEWFVRFRFPGHETAEFENGIPKGWVRCKIGDFCTFLNGFPFKSEDYIEDGIYTVVTIKNVQDGKLDLGNVERINNIPNRMPTYCKLKIGDILMSLTGNVGRVCIVSEDNCLLNQRVCRIESDYPAFSYSFFRQDAIFQTLCNVAYGTAQLNLSPILAGKIKVLLPPVTLRKMYNESLLPFFQQKQKLIDDNRILVRQRDLLLPRLMSGKLEV